MARASSMASGSRSERDDRRGAEASRGDGEEPRARAEVERPAERPSGGEVLERREAEARRLVGAGAEGPPGVDDEDVREGAAVGQAPRRAPRGSAPRETRGSPRGSGPPSPPPARRPARRWRRAGGGRGPERSRRPRSRRARWTRSSGAGRTSIPDGARLPEGRGGEVLVRRGDGHAEGAHAGGLSRPQPRRSFILSRSERSLSARSGTGSDFASCSKSLRCSEVRRFGTTTRTSDVEVAAAPAAEGRDALALEAQDRAGLGALGHGELRLAPVERRDLDRGARGRPAARSPGSRRRGACRRA